MAREKNTDLIAMGEDLFKKAPPLPANARETLVRVTPILALIFGILGILFGVGGLGLLSLFAPVAVIGGVHGYGTTMIGALLWIVASVMMLMAYPKLNARRMQGWVLLFWSEIVNFVGSLLSGNILSAVIGALIALYLLYQIKAHYK